MAAERNGPGETVQDGERARLFVAVTPPTEVIEALGDARRDLERVLDRTSEGRGSPRLRWVAPERLHLTLKFLGQTPLDRIDAVAAAVRETASALATIELGLSDWGTFGSRGGRSPRVVWVGLSGEVEALVRYASVLDEALAARGFEAEQRPFRPHLTLARVPDRAGGVEREALARAIASAAPPSRRPFQVTSLQLVQSHLGGKSARYETLLSAPFNGQ